MLGTQCVCVTVQEIPPIQHVNGIVSQSTPTDGTVSKVAPGFCDIISDSVTVFLVLNYGGEKILGIVWGGLSVLVTMIMAIRIHMAYNIGVL